MTPFGQVSIFYDTPMQRWVPVNRQNLSPDGKTWIYGTLRAGNEYHAVDVTTGKDTTLWGYDKLYILIGLDNTNAYAMYNSSGGASLWRLPLDGSVGSQLKVNGTWQFVNNGTLWGTGAASLPSGAPYQLQRLDVKSNTVTAWIQLDGAGNLVGFDGTGAPIIEVGGPGGDVIVAPSPGVQHPVAKAFLFAKVSRGYPSLLAIGDEHGIWLAGSDGIYFSADGKASKQSNVQAFPAGPCS